MTFPDHAAVPVGTAPAVTYQANSLLQAGGNAINPLNNPTLDIEHLRRLATRLFTDGQYDDADDVLAELAAQSPRERGQIALRRAQVGMLGDRMRHVREQLELARPEYGRHVHFVGLEADMAIREDKLADAAEALRKIGRQARAMHLEEFAGEWYCLERLSSAPVAWDAAHTLPLIEVVVNGQTGRFVLDTGTGDCLLDHRFAQRAQVPPGHIDQASFAGGQTGHWQLSRIDELQIGDSRFSRLPAMVTSLGEAFQHGYDATVDGLIGANLLRAAGGIDIQYARQSFSLGSPGLEDGVALWIAGSHYPLTTCRVNGGPASSWFIDSGMSGMDLACSESAARRHGALLHKSGLQAHGGGGSLATRAITLQRFQHADLEYEALSGAILPGFSLGRDLGIRIGGLIGHEWLAKHRVQLDYHNMQVRITAS